MVVKLVYLNCYSVLEGYFTLLCETNKWAPYVFIFMKGDIRCEKRNIINMGLSTSNPSYLR